MLGGTTGLLFKDLEQISSSPTTCCLHVILWICFLLIGLYAQIFYGMEVPPRHHLVTAAINFTALHKYKNTEFQAMHKSI